MHRVAAVIAFAVVAYFCIGHTLHPGGMTMPDQNGMCLILVLGGAAALVLRRLGRLSAPRLVLAPAVPTCPTPAPRAVPHPARSSPTWLQRFRE